MRPQIGFFPEKCVNCKMCTQVCPGSELFLTVGQVDWQRCTGCLQCVDQCLYEARIGYGKKMTADEVVKKVVRAKVFYGNSGSGVTPFRRRGNYATGLRCSDPAIVPAGRYPHSY